MKVRGRVVLISGASAGIGKEVAIHIASLGARAVAIMARRPEALKAVAREIERAGAKALCLAADVAENAQVQAAVERTIKTFGHIDIVIANAGVGTPITATHPDQRAIDHVININVLGASRLIGAAIPHMVARGSGQIVGVSSLAGYRGMARGGAYCASKAALSTLLESYRVELRPLGIEVTTVMPGFVRTEMTEKNGVKPVLAISVDEAARAFVSGLESGRAVVRFPSLSALLMLLLRVTPNLLFDRIARFMARERLRAGAQPKALPDSGD